MTDINEIKRQYGDAVITVKLLNAKINRLEKILVDHINSEIKEEKENVKD